MKLPQSEREKLMLRKGYLNAKHTDFNCTKPDRWGMALKKDLYNADLFIADNSLPTHRDSRTNTSDIIDYVISSPTILPKSKIYL